MEKELKKLKKEFREKIKSKSLQVTISVNGRSLIFKKNNAKIYLSEAELVEGGIFIAPVRSTSNTYRHDATVAREEINNEVLFYWKRYAEIMNYHFLLVNIHAISEERKKETEELSNEVDLNLWYETVYKYSNPKDQVYSLKKNAASEFLEKSKVVKETLKKIKKEDPTMVYEQEDFVLKAFKFYYHGEKKKINFSIDEKGTYFNDEEEKFYYTTSESLRETLENYFKKIYQKKRMENVFNPPTVHFENYVSKMSRGYITEKMKKNMFEFLKKYYSPGEIEKHSVEDLETLKAKEGSFKKGIEFLPIFEHYFIINSGKVKSFKPEEKEQAKEEFLHLVIEKTRKEIESELKNI